jgi:phospholipid/cholesterol/gamma-HCH transport system permease protein
MEPRTGRLEFDLKGDTLGVRLSGTWTLGSELPPADDVLRKAKGPVRRVAFEGGAIDDWDTGLVAFLMRCIQLCGERDVATDRSGLPDGVQKLLDLAFAVPEKKTGGAKATPPLLARIGEQALEAWKGARDMVEFLGEAALSFGRLFTGRTRLRRSDVGLAIQEAGAEALGIVSLISFLVGVILAFMGAMQLKLFGAEIYVADLVAVGMAREMAPLMTGVILAGRTGAAYAAQLGTMTVNEEIDALRTLGFAPMDFLVLPRMIALMVMMPLLTIYSNVLGIAGGLLIGTTVLGITPVLYWNQTINAVGLDAFTVGIVKASVLGVLVAVAGCMRGMQCGRSASAVGLATTSAVVTAIVAIVVSEAVFAVVFEVLGI